MVKRLAHRSNSPGPSAGNGGYADYGLGQYGDGFQQLAAFSALLMSSPLSGKTPQGLANGADLPQLKSLRFRDRHSGTR